MDEAEWLYLRRIYEPHDNSVCVVVEEAVTGRASDQELPGIVGIIAKAAPIIGTRRVFELSWTRYVAYLVTEEMQGSTGDYKDEAFTGRRFREYSRSHFLTHLRRDTGCTEGIPRHFRLCCLNHIIDVAAHMPPELRILDPDSLSKQQPN
ncbi:MAG: hypothetical protein ACRD1C_03200 [Terriglobales bacterium]